MNFIFATRPSALARWQTQSIIQALIDAWPELDCCDAIITTQGDRLLDRPLPEIGGKGVFTQELVGELLAGRVHAAVHSLKDLPVENPPGLVIGCIPPRGEARDVLVSRQGWHLETLPAGAVVGTSSLRRAAQLLQARPDLHIRSLRGNIDTRLNKALGEGYDAIVLAGAGLLRLGLEEYITQWLAFDTMLPAPGQGALAVQCRASDSDTLRLLAALEDRASRAAVTAERAFLAGLGSGCSLPVAAYAESERDSLNTHLDGLILSADGKQTIRVSGQGKEPANLGEDLARQAIEQGALALLSKRT